MKRTAIATFLIVIGSVTSLMFLCIIPAIHAQDVKTKFSVGDRVEAGIDFRPGPQEWQKATIIQIFNARNQDGGVGKDNVIVAIADAVTSQGSDAVIEPGLLADLNIPNSKSGGVSAKTMSKIVGISDKNLTYTISIIVTDKRYVLFSRSMGDTRFVTAVDETAAIVGRTLERARRVELPLFAASTIIEHDGFNWADWLLSHQLSANGKWYRNGVIGYLVKTEDGKTYLLAADQLRPSTQQ